MTDPSLPSQPRPDDAPSSSTSPNELTLALPADIAAAIEQQQQQSGKPSDQILLDLLRQALRSSDEPSNLELEQLKHRLSLLEALIPRVEELEGKSIAF